MSKAKIDVRTGVTGYRDQLDRTYRYRDRVLTGGLGYRYYIDYQDDVWAFFQCCWHLKDWIRNDPLVPDEQKTRIREAVEQSEVLGVVNDLANGTKHLKIHKSHTGAEHSHLRIATGAGSRLECMIGVNGQQVRASQIAEDCVAEWVKILTVEGLPTERMAS